MTYSIVARDAATGQIGVAVQSRYFSVGSIVPWAEAGVGAVATQSVANPDYGPLGLDAMRRGQAPAEFLPRLTAADPQAEIRQVGVVDASGRAAAHTGRRCIAAAGHQTGPGFSIQANLMDSDRVVPAMVAAWEASSGELADRLLAVLDAAEAAGGDLRGRQSAALLVVAGERSEAPWRNVLFDLRVDDDPEPLVELRRLLARRHAYRLADEAEAALAAGRFDDALAALTDAHDLAPDDDQVWVNEALALFAAGDEESAEGLVRRALNSNPGWSAFFERLYAAGFLAVDDARMGELRELVRRAWS